MKNMLSTMANVWLILLCLLGVQVASAEQKAKVFDAQCDDQNRVRHWLGNSYQHVSEALGPPSTEILVNNADDNVLLDDRDIEQVRIAHWQEGLCLISLFFVEEGSQWKVVEAKIQNRFMEF